MKKLLVVTLSCFAVFIMAFIFASSVFMVQSSYNIVMNKVLAESIGEEIFIDGEERGVYESMVIGEDLNPMPLFSPGNISSLGGDIPEGGKYVTNADIISGMSIFPEHDGANGCGMVAMGVLLQYYNELPTQKQYKFLPSEYYYGDSLIAPCSTGACDVCKQCRANALRDYLTEITPTIGDMTFGVAQNATFPLQHYQGLNNYFQENCESINPNVVYRSWESNMGQDIIDLIDQNIPVLVTIWDGITDNNIDVGQHVVVIYGYKFEGDNVKFIGHLGWQNNHTCGAACVDPCLEKYRKYCEEISINTLIGYCYFKDNELDCFEDEIIGESQTAITELVYNYDNTVTIPEILNKKYVVRINDRAFENESNIRYVNFSSTVQEIGDEAFCNTGIYIANLPNTVTSIGQGVFKNCTALNKIFFPDNLIKIEPYTFYGCSALREVTFSSAITEIGESAFEGTNLRDVLIPSTIQKIGNNAFWGIDEPTLYVEFYDSTPSEWEIFWNNGCDVFWKCVLSLKKDYVVSFVKTNMVNVGYTGTKSPTREGCTFVGWYENIDYTGYAYSSLDIFVAQDDVTYFTKWKGHPVMIEYKNVGDTEFNGTHSDGYPITHVNTTNTVLGIATRTGFTFVGWFDNPQGTGVPITMLCAEDTYSGIITLYAKWKSYSGGGGIFTPIFKETIENPKDNNEETE